MNKKNINTFIYSCLLTTILCSNAYAITEQLNASKAYLSTFKPNTDVIIDSQENKNVKALAPKKEIKFQNKSEVLKSLQSQINLPQSGVMDKETLQYIKDFQEENSLNVTGTLDYNTWFALFEQNDDWKIQTVKNSQKVWEDILQKQTISKSSKFIVVNIPTMTLTAYDWDGYSAKEALLSRVIIGKPSTETPIKDFQIISIKYNPTWTPTTGILKRGAYRKGQLDIDWVKKHGLQILDSENNIVSPEDIDSSEKYHFQQPAGDRNALGVLKFETNSPDNIYLHDTNERHYFGHNTRAYSSGCIRVQDFKDLANWIKNSNDVEIKLKRKDTYYEKINKTPVYLTYNQVIFYESQPFFAPDIYNKNHNTDFQK